MILDYPPGPITLEGKHIRLEPLTLDHEQGLIDAASDGELWNLWYTTVPDPDHTKAYIKTALAEQQAGKSVPFVIINKPHNKIVGTTRYMNIESGVRRLEIGSTWYAQSVQRTSINTECKYELLRHAFETLHCIAVEFRTHHMNEASRKAILRLGALEDGILRNHRIMPDGTMRDTLVYSILNTEWPTIKSHLTFKLNKTYV